MLSRERLLVTDDREFRRCKIFHVVPLTFTLGFVKVIFYAALIVLICTLLMKPELLEQHEHHNKIFGCLCKHRFSKEHHQELTDANHKENKETKQSNIAVLLEIKNYQIHEYQHEIIKTNSQSNHNQINKHLIKERRVHQLYWALLMTSFYLLFSLLLLHGIMDKNAPNMLPFFCLQLFDFILDFLWLFGHLLSTRDLHKLEGEFKCMPLGKHLSGMDPALASFIVFMFCTAILMIQLYFIGVVWSCYRYIMLSRCNLLPLTNTSASSSSSGNRSRGNWGVGLWQVILAPRGGSDASGGSRKKLPKDLVQYQVEEDLPNYEEVLKTAISSFNPPPYVAPKQESNEGENAASNVKEEKRKLQEQQDKNNI